MQLYYAHAMCIYKTEIEKVEIGLIRKHFPTHEIIDPGSFQENTEKSKQGMSYCFRLIDKCDSLVFTRLLGKVTSGVGLEIDHALLKKFPVYELKDGKIRQITKSVKYLSREETWKHYDFWRTVTGRTVHM